MSKHRRGPKRKVGLRQPNGRLQRRRHAFEDLGEPTPERRRHGGVARLEKPIADEDGRPARPYRAATFLEKLKDAGLIDVLALAAGEDFRVQFYKAKLDPLGAAGNVRSDRSTGGTEPTARIENARHKVWWAICAVGGLASLQGSCLWHVVGWEQPLDRWALEQGWVGRRITIEAAQTVVISTLVTLRERLS
jgi:hypothetical protein